MTYQAKVQDFSEAIGTLGGNVYHMHRSDMDFPCIVWQEDGDNDLLADGTVAEIAVTGTLDYFTQQEFDPMVDAIRAKLDEIGAAWGLNSIQYEDATNLIHYEWTWEV